MPKVQMEARINALIFMVHIPVPHNNNQGTERWGGNVMTATEIRKYCLWHEGRRTNPRAVEVPGTNFGVEATIKARLLLPASMGQSTCFDLVVKSERHPVDRGFPYCKKVDRGKPPRSGDSRGAVGSRILWEKLSYQDERRTLDNPYLRLGDGGSVG